MNKLILFFIVLISYSLTAQIDKSSYYSYGNSLYSEVVELPYSDPDSAKVVVLVKANTESLRFQKVNDGKHFGQFQGIFDVEVLFQHEDGIVKNRKRLKDTVYFKSYEQTLSKSIYVESFAEVILARNKYTIEVKFDTKDNTFLNTQKHDEDFSKIPKLYSPLLFNTNREDVFTELQPFILDKVISFDTQGAKIIIPSQTLEDGNYTYKLIKQKNTIESPLNWDEKNEIEGIADKILSVDFTFNNTNDNVTFDLQRNSSYSALSFNLPGVKVIPGVYKLIVYKNNEEMQNFEIIIDWVNQPLSLNKLDYAIDMLKYIATKTEIDSILSADDKSAAFLSYWKAKDPTPNTPFNEAIQQYYSRVDYAFFNYKTISESDGANTDRGKVYILKAAPQEVKEEYKDNRSLLIWEYLKLKKEYVFELIGAGDYRLVEINDIES